MKMQVSHLVHWSNNGFRICGLGYNLCPEFINLMTRNGTTKPESMAIRDTFLQMVKTKSGDKQTVLGTKLKVILHKIKNKNSDSVIC